METKNDTRDENEEPANAHDLRGHGEGEATKFTKVGVAFQHKDGEGLQLMFDAIPVEGRVAVRRNKPKAETAAPTV